MITRTARGHDDTIEVTVTPGGGLRELVLTERALRDGPAALAAAVLDTVHVATTRANRAARLALGAESDEADTIGLTDDPAVADEDVTATTTGLAL